MSAEIITLCSASVIDIPAMLRKCADRLESGEKGEPVAMAAVFINGDGVPTVWGWGRLESELSTSGLLSLGIHVISANKVTRG